MRASSVTVALALALALPARAQDSSAPSDQDVARFNALKQRMVTAQGISQAAVGGTLPAPPPPPRNGPPPPTWQEQEGARRAAFDREFKTGAYDGIVQFSKRCFIAEGCDKPAVSDLFTGANQYVALQADVSGKSVAAGSPAYARRHQEIKALMKPALRDLTPRAGSAPELQSEFIKATDPIVTKVFSPQELIQYVQGAASAADSAPYYAYLGRTLDAGGDAAGARRAFDAALAKDSRSAEAFSGRAEAAYQLGDFAAATADARAALALAPGDRSALATLRFSEGRAPSGGATGPAFMASDSPAAMTAERPAAAPLPAELARRSEELVAQARRGMRMGDARSAVELLARAVQLNPASAQARALSAMAEIRLKDYAGALEDAEAGLKLAPDSAALWDAKAFALNGVKDHRAALAAADRALAINANDAVARFNQAAALAGLGDRAGMLEELEQAAALDPKFRRALEEAGRLPADADILYLFPGEEAPAAPAPAAPAPTGAQWPAWLLLGEGAAAGLGLAFAAGLLARRKRPSPPPLTSVAKPGARRVGGKYELGREVGAGGVLYEGLDRSLDRRVLIRRVRRSLRADPRERARFLAEARTLAGLRHPNVAGVLDIVEQGGEAFVVVERPEGRTLRDVLAREKALPFRRARDLFRGVAAALDEARRLGILHKDVSPEHVVVDDAGRARLTGFGGDDSPVSESDVYAMAACLYEALTGRKPPEGSGPGRLLEPSGIDELFARALARKPEDRYATAGEFLRALESLDAV